MTYDRLDPDIMPNLIEPDTERLRLRQWRPEDRAPFAAINANPEVMEFFPRTLTRDDSDASAEAFEGMIVTSGWGFWAAESKVEHAFIGFVGIKPVPDDLAFAGAVEVGWRQARPYWGRGLATEGARAALRVAFEQLGLNEVVSFTAEGNRRSRAVMDRLGLRHVADFGHPRLPPDHALHRHSLYRITVQEFGSQRGTH